MSSQETLIFGCGNPMLDVAAHLGRDAMDRYELPYGGAVLAEEKHKPLFGEIMKHSTLVTTVGGSAINTIRCANVSFSDHKYMLKKKFPNSCLYFGSIGDDVNGEILSKEMEKVRQFSNLGGNEMQLVYCRRS